MRIELCCEKRSVRPHLHRRNFIYTCSNVGELTFKGGGDTLSLELCCVQRSVRAYLRPLEHNLVCACEMRVSLLTKGGEGPCLRIKLCCEQRSVRPHLHRTICACAKRVSFKQNGGCYESCAACSAVRALTCSSNTAVGCRAPSSAATTSAGACQSGGSLDNKKGGGAQAFAENRASSNATWAGTLQPKLAAPGNG